MELDKANSFKGLRSRLDKPDGALNAVGALVVSQAQRAFREQQFGGVEWKPRRVPNIFGIIADLSQGGTSRPPKRRFQDRPALIDKGAAGLLGSLSWKIRSPNTVLAGSWLPYAAKHQVGGETESLPITEGVQKKLEKFIGKNKDLKSQLGWLLNKKYTNTRIKATVPARPFVGITPQLREEIKALVGAEIVGKDLKPKRK